MRDANNPSGFKRFCPKHGQRPEPMFCGAATGPGRKCGQRLTSTPDMTPEKETPMQSTDVHRIRIAHPWPHPTAPRTDPKVHLVNVPDGKTVCGRTIGSDWHASDALAEIVNRIPAESRCQKCWRRSSR